MLTEVIQEKMPWCAPFEFLPEYQPSLDQFAATSKRSHIMVNVANETIFLTGKTYPLGLWLSQLGFLNGQDAHGSWAHRYVGPDWEEKMKDVKELCQEYGFVLADGCD